MTHEILGRFHSHLTLDCGPERARELTKVPEIRGKVTTIDLENSLQQEVMLTHYFSRFRPHTWALSELGQISSVVENYGVRVIRVKLEQAYKSLHDIGCDYDLEVLRTHGLYTEAHIKLHVPTNDRHELGRYLLKNWVLSHNADADSEVQFINRRIYKQDDRDFILALECELVRQGLKVQAPFQIVKVATEVALYDSAPERDEWWARSHLVNTYPRLVQDPTTS